MTLRAEKFNLYQFFPNGQYEVVARQESLDVIMRQAFAICMSVGGRIGTTVRVLVTDDGDSIAWEWKHGEGVVFPPSPDPR